MKKETDDLIKKRRSVYRSVQLANLTDRDAQRSFFKNIKAYKTGDRPKVFDVRTLCPGKTDGEVAEELAAYFNRISDEFAGLSPADIPLTKSRSLPTLETYEVAARIRRFRKPRSMVRGDVFPSLVTRYADFFAIPLRSIYNEITRSKVWPIAWKLESVTVIPKTTCPADFSGLRNISCTLLASKMYESYVLGWALEEVSLKKNQYGGTRGCGTAHMLINIYQSICENLEDYRACTVLTAIDYAKAFNRMSYQFCLSSLAKMGLSSPLLSLIASFLTNRRMAVRVGSTWSTERPVNGGCPQGSILGVFLFNSTINDLEDDYMGRSHHEVSTPLRDGRPPQPPTPPLAPPDPPAEEVYRLGPDQSDPASPLAGGFFSSTPTREPTPGDPDISDVQVGVVLDNGAPALRRMRNLGRPQQATRPAVAVLPVLDEPNLQTQAKWRQYKIDLFKYVDDNLSSEKLNMDTADALPGRVRQKIATQSQNLFRTVTAAAAHKGMKINQAKTKVQVVSDAMSYSPRAYFHDNEGNELANTAGGDSIKVLGFHISDRPGMAAHVEVVRKKMRGRLWVLRHLRVFGFTEAELVEVYKAVIRPVVDYCCVVYHSQLTDEQDELIERLQSQALRCIFGPRIRASEMRRMAGITTLRQRRIELCDKFALKASASERFGPVWFPRRESTRSTRRGDKFLETYARCDRLKQSPIFYMRRRLNGKEGKIYGERNRCYREDRA